MALRSAGAVRGTFRRGDHGNESLHAPSHRDSGSRDFTAARFLAITASATPRAFATSVSVLLPVEVALERERDYLARCFKGETAHDLIT